MTDLIYDCLERMGGRGITHTGEGYELRCPMCHSKHRSFRVAFESERTGEIGAWVCHKCERKGSIVGLMMRGYKIPLDAAMRMAKDAHIQIFATRPRRPESAEIGQEHIAPYRLNLCDYLVGRGYSEEWLWYYGVGYDPRQNEAVMPVYSSDGKLVGTTRRLAMDGQPNVLSSFKKSEYLWGYDRELAKAPGATAFLTEGQTDTLGLCPLVAPDPVLCPFGSDISERQAELLADRYDSVVLAFDNDPAGWKGIRKALPRLRAAGLPRIWILAYNADDPGKLPGVADPGLRLQTTFEWIQTQKNNLAAYWRRKAKRHTTCQYYEEHQ